MNVPTGNALEVVRAKAQEDVRTLRSRIGQLSDDAIDLILRDARSHYSWTDRTVADELIHELYELTISGPTSMNSCPARFVFVKSPDGKEKLAKSLKPANVPKVMGAPITVIIAYDLNFWAELPFLFPHEDRRPHFEGKEDHAARTAFRNGTLQGGYFMIAARALGLDVGAISGFSNQVVDDEFFSGTSLRSNFLCNIGYADESALFQKLPRFSFDQVCSFA